MRASFPQRMLLRTDGFIGDGLSSVMQMNKLEKESCRSEFMIYKEGRASFITGTCHRPDGARAPDPGKERLGNGSIRSRLQGSSAIVAIAGMS
jgi:hypothetical protein